MVKLTTRPATREDAAAIAAIYNEGIADRIATFETEPRTAEDIAALLDGKQDRYPTIVAERDLAREHREPGPARAVRLPRRWRLSAPRQTRRRMARPRHRREASRGQRATLALFVLVLLLQLADDGGVGERGRVAERTPLGHVAQEAAHDLAAPGL